MKMNSKDMKLLAIFVSIWFCFFVFSMSMFLSGAAIISISGFAVDSNDRLYVGTENEIRVYQDGSLVETIDTSLFRSYAFTITEDETLLLASATNVYVMDLSGNELSRYEDPSAETHRKLENIKMFVSSNGDLYQKKGFFGRPHIVKNETETVFQANVWSVIVKYTIVGLFISMGVFVPYLLLRVARRNKKELKEKHSF